MKKLYPSSLSFAIGQTSFSDSPVGCFRRIMLQANGIREEGEIPQYYKDIGNEWEEEIESRLIGYPGGYKREEPIKVETSQILISGRSDFILDDLIVEAKATASKTANADIVKNGKYKLNHLAQLCFYMWALNKPGVLHYRIYKNGTMTVIGEREFHVSFGYDYSILVDGERSGWTKIDLMQFIKVAQEYIVNREVGPRPSSSLQKEFFTACSYCPLKTVCDRFDSRDIKDAGSFINSAKTVFKGVKE